MSLMSCPECEERVSDKAYWCPHCGFPVREYMENISTENESTNVILCADKLPLEESIAEQCIDIDFEEETKKYSKFLEKCSVSRIETYMAIKMIHELRKHENFGYGLCEIASFDFNRYGDYYIVGLETISNIIYHACLRGILELEYINNQLIDPTCLELQSLLQDRMKISYSRRDGSKPIIVGFAGDKYTLTERGKVLADSVLENWFSNEFGGKPIDWEQWNECYKEYIVKYNLYDHSLFADMYIDKQSFEIITREEKVFYKKLEKHIVEVNNIELHEITEEKRHEELMKALKLGIYASKEEHDETMEALKQMNSNLLNTNRTNITYVTLPSSNNQKKSSVIGRGIVGGVIAGPAGALVGAMSAIDKNIRK